MKENDIYVFYEVIDQLEPAAILDIGMLLKRAGAVSRKAMNREIREAIRLDGVDFLPEIHCTAWDNIYHEVIKADLFLDWVFTIKYDCATFIGLEAFYRKIKLQRFFAKVKECARLVLTDQMIEEWNILNCRVVDLKVEEDCYYLYDFGE